MRQILVPALLALVGMSACLQAQEQERKLLDRINRPNMELTNPMQGKAFTSGGGVNIKEANVGKTVFDSNKSAQSKEFSGARSFLGIKNPWFGSRVFETKTASLSKLGAPAKFDAAFPVRDAIVDGFTDSNKRASVGSSTDVETRPFLVRGVAQGAIDQSLTDKISKKMTIDDIREMLNKPR